jgi:hypothetical protein
MFFQFVVHVTHSIFEDPSLTLSFIIFLGCAEGCGSGDIIKELNVNYRTT